MPFRTAILGALLAGAACAADAATFDLAIAPNGTVTGGLRIEGEIVPGDAQRLLDFYAKYGPLSSPVYLRSKGGDVEEAMKMGTIIRRLRLETSVPVWDTGRQPIDPIKVDHPEDTICASACFLVYAGGATRFGNYLALHRPYLPRKAAQALSDVEYVAAQKAMDPKVKAFLSDMDVDQYWIDRMFAANSQEVYMPAFAEAADKVHHLMGMVPSLEEVVLSKCKEDPDVDRKLEVFQASRNGPLTAADTEKVREIMRDTELFAQCKKTVLSDMQDAAFWRESEPALTAKCGTLPLSPAEIVEIKALSAKGKDVTPDEDARRAVLYAKYMPSQQCRAGVIVGLRMEQTRLFAEALEQSKPKPPQPPVAEDFDAKGLSAVDMAKRGKDAYKAEQWDAAARWFRKAADLGDTEGMRGLSWIYGNGKGVPKDDAEARRWNMMAAEHGNSDAMEVIAYDYENGGKGVAQDYAEAMRWYRKAADSGNGQAMLSIGSLYNLGHGVPQDYTEALRWYKKAAAAGNAFALVQVGFMYALGHGVPQDDEQAMVWMKKAAVSDDQFARLSANDWLVSHPSP